MKIVSVTVNVLLVSLILYFIKMTNSDKSILILLVFYPLLILINTIFFLVLKRKIFKNILVVELLLFLPLIYVCAMYL